MLKNIRIFALFVGSILLCGCYVVPINNPSSGAITTPQSVTQAPVPRPIYTARLYPTNDVASTMGRIAGSISNPDRGHGEFSFTVNGEVFSGEATRPDGVTKGTANAAGNRGNYAKCTYATNSKLGGNAASALQRYSEARQAARTRRAKVDFELSGEGEALDRAKRGWWAAGLDNVVGSMRESRYTRPKEAAELAELKADAELMADKGKTISMSRSSLGTGTCVFSNGAVFDLHISL